MNLPDPSKFKGLNNSALFVVILIFDFILYLIALNYLDAKKLENFKYYLQFGIISFFFLVIIPFASYRFLQKMDDNHTQREIAIADYKGQNSAQTDFEKLKKKGK